MPANRYPVPYMVFEKQGILPEAPEQLFTPALAHPLDDMSVANQPMTYQDVGLRLWETPYDDSATYGSLLAAQDLRYAAHFGQNYDRKLMAIEFGPDANPVGHNVNTFRFVRIVRWVEKTRGNFRIDPYLLTVASASGLGHDFHEGVTGDVAHGEKTPEFVANEKAEQQVMLNRAFGGRFRQQFIDDVGAVITHDDTRLDLRPARDLLAVSHLLTQLAAAVNAGDIAFWLHEHGIDYTPLDGTPGTLERFKNCAGMAIEVSRSTTHDLERYKESFRCAQEVLEDHEEQLRRISEELPPLIAA